MVQLYTKGLIITMLGRGRGNMNTLGTEKSTSLEQWKTALDLSTTEENVMVFRVAMAMSTWDSAEGRAEEGK